VLHWAVKKLSEYGLDDEGLADKCQACLGVLAGKGSQDGSLPALMGNDLAVLGRTMYIMSNRAWSGGCSDRPEIRKQKVAHPIS
jgi:hypothetical protein